MSIEIQNDKVVETKVEEVSLEEFIRDKEAKLEFHQQQVASILEELKSLIKDK